MKLDDKTNVKAMLELLAGVSVDNVIVDARERDIILAVDPDSEILVVEGFEWVTELSIQGVNIKHVDGVKLFRRWTRGAWDIVFHHGEARKAKLAEMEKTLRIKEQVAKEEAEAKTAAMIDRVVGIMVSLGKDEAKSRAALAGMPEDKRLELVANMLAMEGMGE
jgi:hypothetical protein